VRPSDYGVQLREKQKIKRIYGVLEVPFKNYYIAATKSGEVTGHKLLELLEMRLDNVVYRLGWASSRSQARQIVSHGHIRVGDKKVNVPSYQTKAGQKISLTARGQKSQIISINIKEKHTVPAWIATKPQAAEADIIRPPKREEIDAQVNEQLVIEYYSR